MGWREHIARFGTARLPGDKATRLAFLGFLLLAAVLRFWDLAHLPYTHDELSALVRVYPTVGETLRTGVIELDTHPPGVQVFEWLWTKLFTREEADVKLPFIVFDLLALFLLYRMALAWTGEGPALLLTALLATLQYNVLYGQLARPYAAGLFTTALLADQLTRYLAFGQRRMLVGVGVAAVLSAYVHHFSLLLAMIMVATGLSLVAREQRKGYMIMCAVAAVLYLPNVPIFLAQLGQGGLSGWLQPPDASWFVRYAWFIANNSALLAGLLITAVLLSFILWWRRDIVRWPISWVLLIWGLAPLVVGYAYSVHRAPVLQYSVVLFSFPYLVLFLVQGLAPLPRVPALVGCVLIAGVSMHALVHQRKHYDLFYHSKYEEMLREGMAAAKAHGREHTLVVLDAPDNVLRFYLDVWGVPPEELGYVQSRERFDAGQFDSLLHANAGRYVVFGQSNGAHPESVAQVQHRFPYLTKRVDLVDGQVFCFQDAGAQLELTDRDTLAHADHAKRSGTWRIAEDMSVRHDSTGAGWDYTLREFGIGIDLALDSITNDPLDQVEIVAEVDGWDGRTDASIIADVRSGDSTVFYRGGRLEAGHRPNGRAALIVSVSPGDIPVPTGELRLLTYVYSPSKGPLRVRSMSVLRRRANPVRYGTLEPVPWRGRYPAS